MMRHSSEPTGSTNWSCATLTSPARQHAGPGSLADAVHGARAEVREARHRQLVELVERGAGLGEIAEALAVTREAALDLALAVTFELLQRRLRLRMPVRTDDSTAGAGERPKLPGSPVTDEHAHTAPTRRPVINSRLVGWPT